MSAASAARRLIAPIAALAIVAAQVGFASPASAAAHTVIIENYAYRSASLSVRAGDTVTWVNRDKAPHDVVTTSGPAAFRSPMLARGESWSHTFQAAGSYGYYCSVHPDMRAGVTAQAAEPAPASEGADGGSEQDREQDGDKADPKSPSPNPSTSPPASPAASPSATASAPAALPGRPQGPAAQTARLDPLLLLAGLVTAVAVFALLLLASGGGRPAKDPETRA